MKKILGLDIGTNSVGWCLIEHDFKRKSGSIIDMGSRIIPMPMSTIGDFNKGQLESAAAQRTKYRGTRRLIERAKLRKKRLVRALKIMGFIPHEYERNHEYSIAYYNKNNNSNEFQFKESYLEMLTDIKAKRNVENVSYDWTIYFLRKKALVSKISQLELAWVILQFATKRGYHQLRGDKALETDSDKYFISDYVRSVTAIEVSKNMTTYEIELENGILGTHKSKTKPDWIGNKTEFIVTEKRLKDGTISVTMTEPSEDDWTLRKKKTESIISQSGLTIGQYIYSKLKNDPTSKIRGKEVETVDRHFYRNELLEILKKQSEFHDEFHDQKLLEAVADTLYVNNREHNRQLKKGSLTKLLVDDIVFYQRPLKSKKHLISNCKYEEYIYKQKGEIKSKPIKVISKSHPYYQEYRIWSTIHNIRIHKRAHRDDSGRLAFNEDVSSEVLTINAKAKLFELFDSKEKVSQSAVLACLGLKKSEYRWNYEEDIKLNGNELKYKLLKASKGYNQDNLKEAIDDPIKLEYIWHALYSLTDSEENLRSALVKKKIGLGNKTLGLSNEVVDCFVKLEPFAKNYGSLSKKAITKMLPIMRCGNYWDVSIIDNNTLERIDKIISGEYDENIKGRIREHTISLTEYQSFQGLPEWLASYVVYDRHSEMENHKIFHSANEIDVNKLIPHHSLRNPIVEGILRESLLVVKDLWNEYGKPEEIHVELARELKLPAEQRSKWTNRRNENRKINERAKTMLRLLAEGDKSINPFSIGQLELFKLYEEGATNNLNNVSDDIKAIKKKSDPTRADLQKYRLWLEQKYISPYTGQPIPLSKLFSPAYEIEHVIPKSRYYDNSFNNKIICEREANKMKGSQTAYEFICEQGGKKLKGGISILTKEAYEKLVFNTYIGLKGKIKNLLSYDVPKSFISRQLNDTRYISKKLIQLLDPVVRDKKDTDFRSRHLIPMVGGITHQLRHDWGLHDIWKKLLLPRFRRMNSLTNTTDYYTEKDNKIHLSGNETELKRLDHRHHALDALIIACTSWQHIQYINTYQDKKKRYDLMPSIFNKDKDGRFRYYTSPWVGIQEEAFDKLSNIIVSFKQNNRIINRTQNYYQKYVSQSGEMKKSFVPQNKSKNFWALRRQLHQETVHGHRTLLKYKSVRISQAIETPEKIANSSIKQLVLARILECNSDTKKVKKSLRDRPIEVDGERIVKVKMRYLETGYSSTRKSLDTTFTKEVILNKVLGGNTKAVLLSHLLRYDDDSSEAFSPNGIIALNKQLDIPIRKVTVVEAMGKKFSLGEKGCNRDKYVETAKGTNLFFTIKVDNISGGYTTSDESTLSFGDVLYRVKNNMPIIDEEEGYSHIQISPGDAVYVFNENENKNLPQKIDPSRIYITRKFTKGSCYFLPQTVAAVITKKIEFGSQDKSEKSYENIVIKKNCVPILVSRLGKVQL